MNHIFQVENLGSFYSPLCHGVAISPLPLNSKIPEGKDCDLFFALFPGPRRVAVHAK